MQWLLHEEGTSEGRNHWVRRQLCLVMKSRVILDGANLSCPVHQTGLTVPLTKGCGENQAQRVVCAPIALHGLRHGAQRLSTRIRQRPGGLG